MFRKLYIRLEKSYFSFRKNTAMFVFILSILLKLPMKLIPFTLNILLNILLTFSFIRLNLLILLVKS